MRVVVHDYGAHPFQIQLSRELARRGHIVHHLYSGSLEGPKGRLAEERKLSNLSIEAVSLSEPFQKYSFIRRRFQELSYGKLVAEKLTDLQPEVVISCNTPTEAQSEILKASKRLRARFVFWVQDIRSVAARELLRQRIPVLGDLVGRYYIWLEKRQLRQSDEIVLITEDFYPLLREWRVPTNKVQVIPNWAPIDEVPVLPKVNDWSRAHNLADKFCFLYSGTLGLKHNPNILLQLAMKFQDDANVSIVVVSEGKGVEWLRSKKETLGLSNLVLLPWQPYELLPQVLASGDVLVTILRSEAGKISVPSKVLTYLCAQRSMLLAVPQDNLAAKIVLANEAGLVVPPLDVDNFIEAAGMLIHSPDLRQKSALNARNYAEKTFDISDIGDKFEQVIIPS